MVTRHLLLFHVELCYNIFGSVIGFNLNPMAKQISKIEPHFRELVALYERNRNKRLKAQIFDLWEKMILPDKPQITLTQFINWTRTFGRKETDENAMAVLPAEKSDIEIIEAGRVVSLATIEEKLRGVTTNLVDNAANIMADEDLPLKERYYALTIVDKVWRHLTKEKEIAIKGHAEKRETVGMFAKMLRGAMSGEMTLRDIEMLNNKPNEQSVGTTQTITE